MVAAAEWGYFAPTKVVPRIISVLEQVAQGRFCFSELQASVLARQAGGLEGCKPSKNFPRPTAAAEPPQSVGEEG
jgi:hypothetical protein